MKKQWISVKCGLSRDPKHRQAIGESVWLFLHILDIASWEDGIAHDWKDEAEAEEMGMPVRTLREHRRKLDELGYIDCKQKQYTQDIVIHNWTNPREYSGKVYNKVQSDTELETSKYQGDTQGYIQGSTQDVTPTYDSKNQISLQPHKTDEEKPPYKTSKQDLANMSLEAAIFGGLTPSQETQDKTKLAQAATSAFEHAWRITRPWDWWNIKKDWRDLLAFVVEIYQADPAAFGRYVTWYDERGKFAGGKSAPMIQRDPTCFFAAWDEFKRQDKTEAVPQARIYDPSLEPKKNNIPAPERKRNETN